MVEVVGMIAAVWLILSGLLYSLQLQTGSFPKPLTRGRFALSLLSVAAVAAAVFLALSVFFRVETIADPRMKKLRQLDKLVDELAKGWPMEKVTFAGLDSPRPL